MTNIDAEIDAQHRAAQAALTLLAEAKEFRMSEAKRRHLEASLHQ